MVKYYWARPKSIKYRHEYAICELRQENRPVLYFTGDEVDRDPSDYDMVPVENFLGRAPDLRFDMYMSTSGYQAEVYRDGVHLGGQCRDFPRDYEGGDYEKKLDDLYQRIKEVIHEWKNSD